MGRKTSKRKPQKASRRLQVLPTVFECPFCSHEGSCDVKFDRKKQRAQITCRICSETFETDVHCTYEKMIVKVFNLEIQTNIIDI